jgi:hypothetical protein
MPTLPEEAEKPAGPAERIGVVAQRAGAAIGVDSAVTVRALVYFALIITGLIFEEQWAQLLGGLGVVGLALDWPRRR